MVRGRGGSDSLPTTMLGLFDDPLDRPKKVELDSCKRTSIRNDQKRNCTIVIYVKITGSLGLVEHVHYSMQTVRSITNQRI